VAITALLRLHDEAPFVPVNRQAIAHRSEEVVEAWSSPAKRARTLEALILRSRDNPRSFAQQLQPELIELSNHFLAVNYGIDSQRHPDRMHHVLGEVIWLVQPSDGERCPTVDEVERFVEILTKPPILNQ